MGAGRKGGETEEPGVSQDNENFLVLHVYQKILSIQVLARQTSHHATEVEDLNDQASLSYHRNSEVVMEIHPNGFSKSPVFTLCFPAFDPDSEMGAADGNHWRFLSFTQRSDLLCV